MNETQPQNSEEARELLTQEFKPLIVEYITKVNSRYRGNEFTSSQLTKTVMAATDLERTRFPIIHRIVKEILRRWEEQGLCTHIARTKYSRCRRTKDTYRFSKDGLAEIKKRAIDETMKTISRSELTNTSIMRTREYIVKDQLEQLLSSLTSPSSRAEDDEVQESEV